MMITDNQEDYLINILRLSEKGGVVKTSALSKFMGVSPASVSEMLKILAEQGLVNYRKYKGVSLSEEGAEYARGIKRKHKIMERFLTDVLDVSDIEAHEEACKMEHVLSDGSAEKLSRIINVHADLGGQENLKTQTRSLNAMEPGDEGVISHLKCDDSGKIRRLLSIGFVPGRKVKLDNRLSSKGPIIASIGGSSIALDTDLASLVFVEEG